MTQDHQKTCGEKAGFDYCFWAKLLVAIPVLPIIALAAADRFEGDTARGLAATFTVIAIVLLSRWFDSLPAFRKKIKLRKD